MSLSFPVDEWVGSIHANTPLYVRKLVDLTLRERLILAFARRKGRIKLNDGGDHCQWRVRMSLPATETYVDGAIVDFTNHNSLRTLAVDWGGYTCRNAMTIKQMAMNTGQQQLVNQYQEKLNNISQSLRETFCAELYKDGEAAGREENISGLETFFGAGTVTAADRIALPSDTYGLGLASTALADQGGYWSAAGSDPNNAAAGSNWPDGQGSPEYDHISPKLINWSSTAWGTGATSFEANSWRVTSAMIDWLTHTNSMEGQPDIIIYPNDMFRAYKNHEEAKTRIGVPHQQSQDLGFSNVLNHEGVAIHKDYDCPAQVGYALNIDMMMIRSLLPELFFSRGPSLDPHTVWSTLIGVGFLGNVEYQPKAFAKTAAYA